MRCMYDPAEKLEDAVAVLTSRYYNNLSYNHRDSDSIATYYAADAVRAVLRCAEAMRDLTGAAPLLKAGLPPTLIVSWLLPACPALPRPAPPGRAATVLLRREAQGALHDRAALPGPHAPGGGALGRGAAGGGAGRPPAAGRGPGERWRLHQKMDTGCRDGWDAEWAAMVLLSALSLLRSSSRACWLHLRCYRATGCWSRRGCL